MHFTILTGIISIFTPRFAHVRGNNIIPNNAQRNMKNAMIINTGINFLFTHEKSYYYNYN